jgi:hypothetical protein
MKGETVRTLLVVSVVAVLVWLFAESRTLQTRTVTVPVEITPGGSGVAFRLLDPDAWPGTLELELAGPTGLIDALRGRSAEPIVLELGEELPAEPGSRSIDLLDAIRRDELFADSGLTVRRVSPRLLDLQTVLLELHSLPAELDPDGLATVDLGGIGEAETEATLEGTLRLTGLPTGVVADLSGRTVRVSVRRRAMTDDADNGGGSVGDQTDGSPAGSPVGSGGYEQGGAEIETPVAPA